MIVLKDQEEYEEALADAYKIRELEPSFKGLHGTI